MICEAEYDRVTTVLYPFSGMNFINQQVLMNAANRGTKVHEVCSILMQGVDVDIEEEFSGYIESFKKWYEDKVFLDQPDRFFCDNLMITGECDGLYHNKTGLTLFDLKTSANEGKTWKLQGSAYKYLASKAGHNITEIVFVKLSKNGTAPKTYIYDDCFSLFEKCVDVYRHFFKNQKMEVDTDYI